MRELHTTHTTRQGHRHRHRRRCRHTLRSPQLPREVGRREPDGVRWWGPTQPAPALQRLVLSRRRRSLSKSVALLPVPGATSASLVARASPERGGAGQGGEVRTSPSGWSCREGGGRGWMHLKRASSGKTVDTPAEECSPAAPWVTPSDLAAHAVRRCCQGNVGGAQSRSEETARSQGAAGARRKTEGKWPPHTASGGPPADACGVALRATGPFSVRCTTASLKRAPAGSGRSRDRLKLRPQLLGGVRMAGLERLLARCPRPDAAAISPPRSFAAFAERRRWVGPNHAKFLFTRTPALAELRLYVCFLSHPASFLFRVSLQHPLVSSPLSRETIHFSWL